MRRALALFTLTACAGAACARAAAPVSAPVVEDDHSGAHSPEDARRAALAAASSAGILGVLLVDAGPAFGGMFEAEDDAGGTITLDDDDAGAAFGYGGIGLSGVGSGGGGPGLGGFGGAYDGGGYGRGGRTTDAGSAQLRAGQLSVQGRLPPEVVARVVRQHFGRLRYCYDLGLMRIVALAGTVVVRFTIDAQGNVGGSPSVASATLADPQVVACVLRVFATMSFPAPEAGSVTVSYPIVFAPS